MLRNRIWELWLQVSGYGARLTPGFLRSQIPVQIGNTGVIRARIDKVLKDLDIQLSDNDCIDRVLTKRVLWQSKTRMILIMLLQARSRIVSCLMRCVLNVLQENSWYTQSESAMIDRKLSVAAGCNIALLMMYSKCVDHALRRDRLGHKSCVRQQPLMFGKKALLPRNSAPGSLKYLYEMQENLEQARENR